MTTEQVIKTTDTFFNEICNGGFLQYFINCDGQHLCHIVECLQKIGADDAAALYTSAISSLPCILPSDLDTRRKLLADIMTPEMVAKLEEFDSRFSSLSDKLESAIASYIDSHQTINHVQDGKNKRQKDHYALIVKYATAKSLSFNDMADPMLRRKASKAAAEVRKLDQELLTSPDKGQKIIQRLLQHDDACVRITAGAYCIMAEVLVDEGRSVLDQIVMDNTVSPELRFEASNCLKYCKPYNS